MTSTGAPAPLIKTLLLLDLVDSTGMVARLGDARAHEILAAHDHLARSLLARFEGQEIDKTDGFLLLFERPIQAVGYALAYHRALAELGDQLGVQLQARAGIHLGEVFLRENSPDAVAQGAKPLEVEGLAKHTVARIAALAQGRQTLLTHAAFDLARRATVGDTSATWKPQWLAHGSYLLQGLQEPLDIFEVGLPELAPLHAPEDSSKARRAIAAGDDVTLGWRPAVGMEIPGRQHWVLERKLGDGGFGEVWLARQEKLGNQRVFKFCYDAERLRALKREVTLFRILRDALGARDDITTLLDWNFKEAPFFLEAEYTGSDLAIWAEAQGGIAQVPLPVRLEIVAQVATALAAAHSVGVLHKDIKPSNILIAPDAEGHPRARLADFGIGLIADPSRIPTPGITLLGMTEMIADTSSSFAGTRLYLAPELLEGKVSTMQSDLYALGVVLFQMAAGDLSRALAPGWEREVADELLAEDIASLVDGDPGNRPRSAVEVAERLRRLEARREALAAARQAEKEAETTRLALIRFRRRRRLLAAFTAVALIFSIAMGLQMRRTAREAARANREAEVARRISEFLVGLFEVSDPDASLGKTVTAQELLDQGVQRISTELQDQPATRATLMSAMARAYSKLGLYEPAIQLQREALAQRRKALGPRHPEVAESLQELGQTLVLQGRFDEAEKLLDQALSLRIELLGPRHLEVAKSTIALADLKLEYGRYAEAERLYKEALAIKDANGISMDQDRAQVLSSLALTYQLQGRNERVEELYDTSLAMTRKIAGPEHTLVASILGNKGRWLMQQRRYQEAEACYEKSLEIKKKRLGGSHPAVAFTLYKLADLLNVRGDYTRAENLAREGLAILEPRLPQNHWRIAFTKVVLGASLAGQKRFPEAERLLLASYPILRDAAGVRSAQTQQALSTLVSLYDAWGKPREAARYRALLQGPTKPAEPR